MKVLPVTSGTSQSGNAWQKQEFVFEYFEHETDRWSDKVVLSVMNDRIKEYDLHEGDEVIIGFGHSAREYQGRWFNDLRAYKIEKVATRSQQTGQDAGGVVAQPQQTQPAAAQGAQAPASQQGGQEAAKEDDLPF